MQNIHLKAKIFNAWGYYYTYRAAVNRGASTLGLNIMSYLVYSNGKKPVPSQTSKYLSRHISVHMTLCLWLCIFILHICGHTYCLQQEITYPGLPRYRKMTVSSGISTRLLKYISMQISMDITLGFWLWCIYFTYLTLRLQSAKRIFNHFNIVLLHTEGSPTV